MRLPNASSGSIKGSSLTDFPELVQQWHPTKNGDVKPQDCSAISSMKAWWCCPVSAHHEWRAAIRNRTCRGTGCPLCVGRRATVDNWFKRFPLGLIREWDVEKNGNIEPDDILYSTDRRVWWKCSKNSKHVWRASVANRIARNGCPICEGRPTTKRNSLVECRPDLAMQWHPSKNADLLPEDVTIGSPRRVWWLCPNGPDHEWDAIISMRVQSSGCPFCRMFPRRLSSTNSLVTRAPHLIAEWHPTKNGTLTPKDVTVGTPRAAWWVCPKGHEYETLVYNRTRNGGGTGCPVCAGHHLVPSTTFAAIFPNIAAEWHPTKNGSLLPTDVAPHSGKSIWWKCAKGLDHEWQTSVNQRTDAKRRGGCPFCSNFRVSVTNSLASRFPDIALQWHPTKNRPLKPKDVVFSTTRSVYWLCHRGHEWNASVRDLTRRGRRCPHCVWR